MQLLLQLSITSLDQLLRCNKILGHQHKPRLRRNIGSSDQAAECLNQNSSTESFGRPADHGSLDCPAEPAAWRPEKAQWTEPRTRPEGRKAPRAYAWNMGTPPGASLRCWRRKPTAAVPMPRSA